MDKALYISDMPADVSINPQEHNYIKLLMEHCPELLLRRGVNKIHIAHDDNCKIYRHGNCNCKCDITIEDGITDKVIFSLRWKSEA